MSRCKRMLKTLPAALLSHRRRNPLPPPPRKQTRASTPPPSWHSSTPRSSTSPIWGTRLHPLCQHECEARRAGSEATWSRTQGSRRWMLDTGRRGQRQRSPEAARVPPPAQRQLDDGLAATAGEDPARDMVPRMVGINHQLARTMRGCSPGLEVKVRQLARGQLHSC